MIFLGYHPLQMGRWVTRGSHRMGWGQRLIIRRTKARSFNITFFCVYEKRRLRRLSSYVKWILLSIVIGTVLSLSLSELTVIPFQDWLRECIVAKTSSEKRERMCLRRFDVNAFQQVAVFNHQLASFSPFISSEFSFIILFQFRAPVMLLWFKRTGDGLACVT